MKQFFRDYVALAKESIAFYRQHWLGMTILTIAGYGIGYGIGYAIDAYTTKKQNEKLRKELEELNITWQTI